MNANSLPGVTRREFLGVMGAMSVTIATGLPSAGQAAPAKKVLIGVQLYSVREQCKTDLPGMLKAISQIGYKGVEFAGYHGRTAKEVRKMLDDNGLVACGTHTAEDTIKPDKLKETIEFNRTIGNKYLIVPWMTGKSRQEWLDKAKHFNEVAEKLKPEGMLVGYHAHAHDFQKFEGDTAWDLFFGTTKPEVVMQLDTGNCASGGADPVAVLKKYPGRARTIHAKAHGGGPEAVIGEDKINWKEVLALCEGPAGTEWYVVEHETSKDPLDAVKRSFEALKKFGRA